MIHIVDTHSLIWFLGNDKRLGPNARLVFEAPSPYLVIPTIVMAEIKYLSDRRRVPLTFDEVARKIRTALQGHMATLDEEIVEKTSTTLEMHDGIICATAVVYANRLNDSAAVITRDEAITASGLVQVVW